MDIDIGIEESERQRIADGLSRVLADSYTLYLKTHNFQEFDGSYWRLTELKN